MRTNGARNGDRLPFRASRAARLPVGSSEKSACPHFLLIPLLFLSACPQTNNGTDAGRPPECTGRADCEGGKICTAEQFCDSCDSSGQCRTREVCDAEKRLCRLREGWGEACAENEQCPAGSWCKLGLCLDRSAVSLCPGGDKSECGLGERCNTVTTVCEEDLGCSDNGDCSPLEVCNTGSRTCVPRCTVETQADVCSAGERCVDEKCVQCATNAECGPGLVCDPAGKCNAGNVCYTDRDCKVPLICFTQTGACLPKAPPCVSDDYCAPDKRCDVGSGKCVPRACQADRYEPNNAPTTAFGVSAQAYRDLTLCLNDQDWYSINLARGDQLGVNLDADPFSENVFSTFIKDDSGRTLASGKLLVSYVAPAAQKYYVSISTTDPFQLYDVTFLLSRGTPCDDDALEPNDSQSQPTALNTQTQIDGAICPQDQDWFRATVPAAQGLRASLINYSSANGLLRLCAFDGLTQLGCSEDPAPVVDVPAATAGGKQLTVRVVGSNDRTANAYTLKVEYP